MTFRKDWGNAADRPVRLPGVRQGLGCCAG